MNKETHIKLSKHMEIVFYFTKCFELNFAICGYFDNRPRINIGLFFFRIIIVLPIRNEWTDECDPPEWGFSIFGNSLWIYSGGKGNLNGGNNIWSWSFPFVTTVWIATSYLTEENKWDFETDYPLKKGMLHKAKTFANKGSVKKFWEYNYTDSFDQEIIPTTIHLKKMEWRPKWLTWTKLFNKTRTFIEVSFSKECGKDKGSWKGGVLGCS